MSTNTVCTVFTPAGASIFYRLRHFQILNYLVPYILRTEVLIKLLISTISLVSPFWKLHLRVILDVLAKLPNLQIWNCNVGQVEWTSGYALGEARYTAHDRPGPCQDSPHGFASSFQKGVELPHMRHARLDSLGPLADEAGRIDQRIPMPDTISPVTSHPLGPNLRLLSY